MSAAPTTFQWFVTSPNPRSPQTGPDAGQRGWRLHAVPLRRGEAYEEMKRRPALCGLWPRHGWGGDLFIDNECDRCQKAMTKREAKGETFLDLSEVYQAEREQIEARVCQAYRDNPKLTDEEGEALRSKLRREYDAAATSHVPVQGSQS